MVKLPTEAHLEDRVSSIEKELAAIQETMTTMSIATDAILGIQEELGMLREHSVVTQDSIRQVEEMMFRQFGQDRRVENGRIPFGGERERGCQDPPLQARFNLTF